MDIKIAKSEIRGVQSQMYVVASEIGELIQEGKLIQAGLKKNDLFELADRLGEIQNQMTFSCITTIAPEAKRYVIASHAEGDTVQAGDIIEWTVTGGPVAGEEYDVFVDSIDQGTATATLSRELIDVPEGAVQICIKQLINGIATGVESCCEFVGAEQSNITKDVISSYDMSGPDIEPLTLSDWQNIVTPDYNAFTGDVSNLSVVNGKLVALHPDGSNADLNASHVISPSQREVYCVEFDITVPDNFSVNNPTDGGKLGWGVAGGSYVRTLSDGTMINVIMGGGSTALTGHSQRWGFRGTEFTIYSYHINRAGMPSTSNNVFGEDLLSGVTMTPGQTYSLGMEITLNDPNVANGIIRGYINGNLVIQKTGVIFMENTPEVDRGLFSSNTGGAGVAANDMYFEYDNVLYSVSPT